MQGSWKKDGTLQKANQVNFLMNVPKQYKKWET